MLWMSADETVCFDRAALSPALDGRIFNAIGIFHDGREYSMYRRSGRYGSTAAFLPSQHGYRAAGLDGGLPILRDD